MTQPPISEIIDPEALSPLEREHLIDELYAAHDRIFDGVGRDEFAAYVVRSPAARTRIQVLRVGGQVVGYAAFHEFECTIEGQRGLVVRAEVGMLPAYRRQSRCALFVARECLGVVLRNLGTPVWGLSCATNPATYRAIARHADQVWPHWERPTPSHLQTLMDELAVQFGMRPVEGGARGVFQVGWKTRQEEAEALGWRYSTHPAARLYVQRNPGYVEGHGMLLLVPITAMGMVRACLRLARNKLRRGWRRRAGRGLPASVLHEVAR